MITRRKAVQKTLGAAAVLAFASRSSSLLQGQTATPAAPAAGVSGTAPAGPFHLPKLPYAYDALEPHIDAQTMEIHYSKHHAAYVNNLNKALASHPKLHEKSLEEIIKDIPSLPAEIQTTVRNNAGGAFNHSLFWHMMSKGGGGEPKGTLGDEIKKQFGSFSKFKEDFTKAATSVFGSGWAWLLWNSGKLEIRTLPNQDAPVFQNHHPLLGLDVWEHAYYLKYQNRRADYIGAFFNVIAWEFVQERLNHAKG